MSSSYITVREACERLEAERVSLAKALATTPASSFEDYMKRVGVCDGLARAQAILKTTVTEEDS